MTLFPIFELWSLLLWSLVVDQLLSAEWFYWFSLFWSLITNRYPRQFDCDPNSQNGLWFLITITALNLSSFWSLIPSSSLIFDPLHKCTRSTGTSWPSISTSSHWSPPPASALRTYNVTVLRIRAERNGWFEVVTGAEQTLRVHALQKIGHLFFRSTLRKTFLIQIYHAIC